MKKIFSLVLILALPLVLLCGCGTKSVDYKDYEQRFIFVGKYETIEDPGGYGVCIYLLVDKETKIIYLYDYDGGMTPLLDKKGNVTYYNGSLEEME